MKWTPIFNYRLTAWGGFLLSGLIGANVLFDSMRHADAQVQSQGVSWGQIIDLFKRKKVRGASRDPLFCVIAPIASTNDSSSPIQQDVAKVWNIRPLFLWKGTPNRIEVRQKDTYDMLWSQSLSPKVQHIQYQGKPLQQGQTYIWRLLSQSDSSFPIIHSSVPFQVLSEAESSKVDVEIARVASMPEQSKISEEAQVLRRVNYLAENHLWSDAEREALSVKHPSPQLTQFIQKTTSTCKTD
jgi:hypothetical protein